MRGSGAASVTRVAAAGAGALPEVGAPVPWPVALSIVLWLFGARRRDCASCCRTRLGAVERLGLLLLSFCSILFVNGLFCPLVAVGCALAVARVCNGCGVRPGAAACGWPSTIPTAGTDEEDVRKMSEVQPDDWLGPRGTVVYTRLQRISACCPPLTPRADSTGERARSADSVVAQAWTALCVAERAPIADTAAGAVCLPVLRAAL